MFFDDYFGADYFANDYYPPADASGGGGSPPVSFADYVLRSWWFGRHRVVS